MPICNSFIGTTVELSSSIQKYSTSFVSFKVTLETEVVGFKHFGSGTKKNFLYILNLTQL